MSKDTDRIERQVVLKVPRARVWKALTTAEEFGRWFRVRLEGKRFAVGEHVQGYIDLPGYEHLVWEVLIERMEPERFFSWRWHPAAIDAGVDYSKEPTTLVEFELRDIDQGTVLTVVESGFDKIPAERRLDAFRLNSGGWETQMVNIEKHVAAGLRA